MQSAPWIRRIGSKNFRTGAIAAGVLAGTIAVVRAMIPDGSGVIHACYQNLTGALRVAESAAGCRLGETALAWSQTGLQGPRGIAGPAGPQGVQGPVGPAGPQGCRESRVLQDPPGRSAGSSGFK